MHIVLIVQLVFFMHFAVTQKSGIITGEQKDNITNEPAQQKDEKYTTKATMPELHDVQQGKINSL